MSIDVIGDFLTIIRNGIKASKVAVVAPYSKTKYEIAKILLEEGFIRDVAIVDEDQLKKSLKIVLKYINRESIIHEITRVSKPGCRYYTGVQNVASEITGLGLSIVTTNRGILSHKKAKQLNLGGEVICTVW